MSNQKKINLPLRIGKKKIVRQKLIDRITKRIEDETGLSKEFIDTHSIWELEEILGIPHYSIRDYYYVYQTLKCGCTIKRKVYFDDHGDW